MINAHGERQGDKGEPGNPGSKGLVRVSEHVEIKQQHQHQTTTPEKHSDQQGWNISSPMPLFPRPQILLDYAFIHKYHLLCVTGSDKPESREEKPERKSVERGDEQAETPSFFSHFATTSEGPLNLFALSGSDGQKDERAAEAVSVEFSLRSRHAGGKSGLAAIAAKPRSATPRRVHGSELA